MYVHSSSFVILLLFIYLYYYYYYGGGGGLHSVAYIDWVSIFQNSHEAFTIEWKTGGQSLTLSDSLTSYSLIASALSETMKPPSADDDDDDEVEFNVLGCRVDIYRDKLWPVRKHGSMLLYVHGNHW